MTEETTRLAPREPAGHGGPYLSRTHQRVKRLRRLLRSRRARESERRFVLEGSKIIGEALEAGIALEGVYVAEGSRDALPAQVLHAGIRVFELAPGVLERVADTVTPQPVLAVAPYVDIALQAALASSDGLILVCVDVRDPGNAGTVLRTAEAAGVSAVVLCGESVDVYNPKTVRASAGSLFHVDVVVEGDPHHVLKEMGELGLRRLATAAHGGRPYDQLDLTAPTAVVLGNEAHGLPADLADAVDEIASIPMAGRGGSLNVGMAAAVLCFEAARQRRVET
jgi:TrmH family RNA methyltransferase